MVKNKKNSQSISLISSEFIPLQYPAEREQFKNNIKKMYGTLYDMYPDPFIENGYANQTNGKYIIIEHPYRLSILSNPNKDKFLASSLREAISDITILDNTKNKEDELIKRGWEEISEYYRENGKLGKFFYNETNGEPNSATIEGLESLLFSSRPKGISLWIARATPNTKFGFLKRNYGIDFSEKLSIRSFEHHPEQIEYIGDRMKAYMSLIGMYKEKDDNESINCALTRIKKEFKLFIADCANSKSVKIETRRELCGDGLMFPHAYYRVNYGVYSNGCLEGVRNVMGIIKKGIEEIGHGTIAEFYSPKNVKLYLERARVKTYYNGVLRNIP